MTGFWLEYDYLGNYLMLLPKLGLLVFVLTYCGRLGWQLGSGRR